jgi:hypothetical protein
MKSKKFEKKLELNKETIANLKINQMKDIRGGLAPSEKSECATCSGCTCPNYCSQQTCSNLSDQPSYCCTQTI